MQLKAFVSSTSKDLAGHRAHVVEALRHAGIQVDPMEDWQASPRSPEELCQQRIEGCQLLILLIARRRGHVPLGGSRSMTQLEFDAAQRLGIETLVFLLAEDATWPAEFDQRQDPSFQDWLAQIQDSKVVGFFRPEPASVPIEATLTRWALEDATKPNTTSPWLDIPRFHWQADRSPPGALLRPECHPAVPFHFRDAEMADLAVWCDDELSVAVRLYTGPGGRGKTRLMLELCKARVASGWKAGFLCTDRPADVELALASSADVPHLVIIDYAETRRDMVLATLEAALARTRGTFRLVLLARSVGDWWNQLRSQRGAAADLLAHVSTKRQRLAPLAPSSEERRQSFHTAAAFLAKTLDVPQPKELREDLDDPCYDEVLLIHLQALAALNDVEVRGEYGLLNFIIQRERRFWRERAAQRQLPEPLTQRLSTAMATLTLCGGCVDAKSACQLLRQVPGLEDQPNIMLRAIAQLLHELYVGQRWIDPIRPDLLAEHLIDSEGDQDPDWLSHIFAFQAADD